MLSVWALVQIATACVGLANKGEVWESELEFNTHGLSLFQLLIHLYLAALAGLGLLAHARKDAYKAQVFVVGFVGFALLLLIFQIVRVMTIEADAAEYQLSRCQHCMALFGKETCMDKDVEACTEYDVLWFKSFAYVVGLAMMFTGLLVTIYVTLVARSFAHHLGSGDGLAGSDALAAGGDDGENSAYVKFDSLLGGRRGVSSGPF